MPGLEDDLLGIDQLDYCVLQSQPAKCVGPCCTVQQHQFPTRGLNARHWIDLDPFFVESTHETLDPQRINLLVGANLRQRDHTQHGHV